MPISHEGESRTEEASTHQDIQYWTPTRLIAGLIMSVVLMGLVVYAQWDNVVAIWGGSSHHGSNVRVTSPVLFSNLFDITNLQIDRTQIIHGGPPKDGIPSITDPETVPVSQADFMQPDDRVVGVTINGDSRAYPIKVLNYHECINDVLGGVPIAVVFCPLCDSVSVVDRRLGEKTYEFGISGFLYNSNVLLYDRTDHALWSQVGLEAVSGPNAGKSLKHYSDWTITTFERWYETFPQSSITTMNTGYYGADRYNSQAYASYFQTDRLMFPAQPRNNGLFPNKYPVIGIRLGDQAKAYPVRDIYESHAGRVEDAFNGGRVVLEHDGVSGSVRVVEVPEGAQVVHTFWFAWYAFHPHTQVYQTDAEHHVTD
ncbi:MAG: DUF3179 domain-containing protein [Gammaproteobacteria bacterium]|nr:MAG: DUF3179 domain-containing protein [Gammaproteobacteria bacterium]